MIGADILVALLVLSIPIITIGQRWNLPYPVVLVIGGLVLGFIPGLPTLHLNSQFVFIGLLPPLLYWESITAPSDEMRRNARWIGPLTIGLVAATTAAVAVAVRAVDPTIGWGVALVLGAIVAPTDEVASAPVMVRLGVPRHIVAVIEGESLLNDAVSLVFYAVAVGAVVTGTFSIGATALRLLITAVGSIALGIGVGWIAIAAWRWIHDERLQSIISVTVPYLAYLPADRLQLSGVLTVVAAGLYINRRSAIVLRPAARLSLSGFWETIVFLINAVLFIVIGLQLHSILLSISRYPVWMLVTTTVTVNVVVIAIRFIWVFAQGYVPGFSETTGHEGTQWKHLLVTALSGLRGSISLAAAIAVPLTIAGGTAFPFRDLVIFLTFSVIFVTLVGGGVTLPFFIRLLGVTPDDAEALEEREAYVEMAKSALARLQTMREHGEVPGELADILQKRYEYRIRRYDRGDETVNAVASQWTKASLALIDVERNALADLRMRHRIDNVVMRRLQNELDMSESQAENVEDSTPAAERGNEPRSPKAQRATRD